jgi:hypothetical protein
MSHPDSPPSGATLGDGIEGAQAKASDIAGHAQEKAQQAAGEVQGRLRAQLDQRASQVGTQIGEQASDLRLVGESLREQGKDSPARVTDQVAQYAEKVGGYLRNNGSRTLIADAEDFGRRQPWAVATGSLALGFIASRFLKASSGQRYRSLTAPRPAGVNAVNGGPPNDGMREGPRPADAGRVIQ